MALNFSFCQLVILLLSVEFSTVSCDTFYIVTSPSNPCPGEYIGVPCLTLQQYAANPGQGENITFLIEPGVYSLSTVLIVSDGYNFTMSSTDTVICTSATARFEFYRVDNIHISGVTFQGCRNGAAIQIITATSTAIIGSLFIRNRAGIRMTGVTRAIIMRSNFTQNIGNVSFEASNSMVTIDKSYFYNNTYNYRHHGSRGQIYTSSSNISIKDSHFNNNGRVSINAEYCSIRVDGSEFNYNDGRAISAYQSSNFQINNTIFYGNSGGAISVSASGTAHIQINNTAFYFNAARYGGGAIYLSYDGGYWYYYNSPFQLQVHIHNTTFHSNIAANGGAIYIYIQSNIYSNFDNWWQLSIVKSRFINNTASLGNGGAIMLSESRQNFNYTNPSIITRCQFINNRAINASGGAIYKEGKNTKLVIDRSSYVSNTADAFGGAIYVSGENNSIQVTSITFRNNAAVGESGGAIYSNGRYANVTLTSSTFHNNSASYCGVLNVDNYNHFSVNLTNSIFTYNTALGQTIGGGVACIVNATINIINSVFKHNFANFHAGVFYIDESHTTVDGNLFINNSAALDGGVFYTYIHASDYIIRRSQFSENTARHDGGVILIGRLNCYVSIDETIFDFNSAGNRGGVISMVASSLYMVINRTNIFNNTAQFGGVISACNSEVTLRGDSLVVIVDPLLPFCKLYEGTVQHANITPPPETIITTEPMVRTEQPIHTQSEGIPTSSPNHIIPDQTDKPSTRSTPNVVPQTTHSTNDHTHMHAATGPLNEGTNKLPITNQSPTSPLISDNEIHAAREEETDKKVATSIALSATSLVISLIAILLFVTLIVLILCVWKKGSLKNTISKMKGFSVNPSRTFRRLKPHTSPIYNPNSSEDEDDTDAL